MFKWLAACPVSAYHCLLYLDKFNYIGVRATLPEDAPTPPTLRHQSGIDQVVAGAEKLHQDKENLLERDRNIQSMEECVPTDKEDVLPVVGLLQPDEEKLRGSEQAALTRDLERPDVRYGFSN